MRAALVTALGLVAFAGTAHADRRAFTYAFQYGTEAPGDTSLALWQTHARPTFGSSTTFLDFQLQLQHGLTEHWDAALYTTFTQTTSGDVDRREPFGAGEMRLQNRYRFVDRSEWPVDVQLQLDAAKQAATSDYELALRVVLARDIDAVSIAANVVGLRSFGTDSDHAFDLAWSAGASYELHPTVNVGVDAFGLVDPTYVAFGPVVSVAPSPRLWLAVSGVRALVDSNEVAVRALLGLEL